MMMFTALSHAEPIVVTCITLPIPTTGPLTSAPSAQRPGGGLTNHDTAADLDLLGGEITGYFLSPV